ncbi:MAG: ATP-binding protein [Nanohaloarchaea archaeon SW_7_43_1]|nr:MAG: ATP-binding protein [Nanohaloarchaea archaeon SW_7_43_1]
MAWSRASNSDKNRGDNVRTAFVGKGGSGKSTLAALFIEYLKDQEKQFLAADADINQHLAELIDADFEAELAVSKEENSKKVREYVKGDNSRIKDQSNVVKSTPPGRGSNFIRLNGKNKILSDLATEYSDNWFMHIGTYEKEGIGASCYHTSLTSFENILSHLKLEKDEWLVSDMVAGTDAFANTLHAQFDLIVLVVEPTPEGVKVYEQYKELSQEAGVFESIAVVGNKVDCKHDREYLQENIDSEIIGYLPRKPEIKMARQQHNPLSLDLLNSDEKQVFQRIAETSEDRKVESDERLEKLKEIHRKVSKKQHIKDACGDVKTQIDEEFSWSEV